MLLRCLFLVVVFLQISGPIFADDLAGLDLFLRAVEFQGDNPGVIRTCSAIVDVKTVIHSETSPDIEQHEYRISVNTYRNGWVDKRKIISWKRDKESESLSLETVVLSLSAIDASFRVKSSCIRWEPEKNKVTIANRIDGILDFHQFGRLQGHHAQMTANLLRAAPAADGSWVFDPLKINAFKEEHERFSQATQEKRINALKIIKTEDFEGSTVKILETTIPRGWQNIRTQFFHVDPNRGFICPLVQMFYQDGAVAHEWRSQHYFLDEESELWFPEEFIYSHFSDAGTLLLQKNYTVIQKSIRLNGELDEETFLTEIPAGAELVDIRTKQSKHYVVNNETNLDLNVIRNLENISALEVIELSDGRSIVLDFYRKDIVFCLLITALIIIVVFIYQRTKST